MKPRGILILACLVGAFVAATCKVASAQAVNPSSIEFTSLDHAAIGTYRVCFYPSATATQATRCTDVPVAAAVSQGNSVYRIPRVAWEAGLALNTDFWPKVGGISTTGEETALVAPAATPFFFRLRPRPRDVSNVILRP